MGWKIALLAGGAMLAACGSAAAPGDRNGPAKAAGDIWMPVPRAAHSAVAAADGRVLLIGGCVAESCEGGPDSATVDAFDPETRRIERAGSLSQRRVSTSAVALQSGAVLIAGGWAGSSVSSSVELFDPATRASRQLGDLALARADIAAIRLPDGRVLLAGGYDGDAATAQVEIFDPSDSSIKPAGRLLVPRTGAGAALLSDGRVLIVGGGTSGGRGVVPTDTAEIFDPATGRSTRTGSLAQARYKHAAVALPDGGVLVLGGSDARDSRGKLDSIEKFDPATGTFAPAGRPLERRFKIGSAVVLLANGKVLVAGGAPRSELYDPVTRRSEAIGPDFGRRLNFATATRLANGTVFVAGGYDENGIRMNNQAWIVRADAAPAPAG